MKYKVILLEDDVIFQIRLEEMMLNTNFELLAIFSSPHGLYEYLASVGPCILLCDLVIDGRPKGFEFIQNLDLPHVSVVAISMMTEVEMFQKIAKRSIPFIVKPFHRFTLLSILQNQANLISLESESNGDIINYIFLSNKTKNKEKIWIKDILYLETQGNYLTYYCVDSRKFVEKVSMRFFLNKYSHFEFIQIHKNFSMNIRHVVKVNRDSVILSNTVKLPLSKTYRKLIMDHIF